MKLTPIQQALLIRYQQGRIFHPFTCPRDHGDKYVAIHVLLIPGEQHWFCGVQGCDYTQAYGGLEERVIPLVAQHVQQQSLNMNLTPGVWRGSPER